jgi:hypothetical protein
MSENTKIEWCDHTFNPWEGCQKLGPGCDHCYAETRNARFGGGVAVNWGPGALRRRTSPANWRKPLGWNAAHAEFFARHGRRQPDAGKPRHQLSEPLGIHQRRRQLGRESLGVGRVL